MFFLQGLQILFECLNGFNRVYIGDEFTAPVFEFRRGGPVDREILILFCYFLALAVVR